MASTSADTRGSSSVATTRHPGVMVDALQTVRPGVTGCGRSTRSRGCPTGTASRSRHPSSDRACARARTCGTSLLGCRSFRCSSATGCARTSWSCTPHGSWTGTVSLGAEVNVLPAAIEQCRAAGGLVIAQVNRHMPYTFGDGEYAVEDFDYLVEADEPLVDLPPAGDRRRLALDRSAGGRTGAGRRHPAAGHRSGAGRLAPSGRGASWPEDLVGDGERRRPDPATSRVHSTSTSR